MSWLLRCLLTCSCSRKETVDALLTRVRIFLHHLLLLWRHHLPSSHLRIARSLWVSGVCWLGKIELFWTHRLYSWSLHKIWVLLSVIASRLTLARQLTAKSNLEICLPYRASTGNSKCLWAHRSIIIDLELTRCIRIWTYLELTSSSRLAWQGELVRTSRLRTNSELAWSSWAVVDLEIIGAHASIIYLKSCRADWAYRVI